MTKVKDNDEVKPINEILVDPKATERILVKWSQPNPEAKNDELFGKRRNNITETTGGRRFTQEELIKSRASIPRFQNITETMAYRDYKSGEGLITGYSPKRQITTYIDGLDWNEQNQLDSNRYMAWLGGQVTLQSQSKTGGFNKPRDVVNSSYYDKLMNEKDLSPQELYELRKKEREQRKERTMTVGEHIKESSADTSIEQE